MVIDDEHRAIRSAARKFARERLAPGAAARDRESRFPLAEFKEMGRLGYLGMLVPSEWEGAGTDMLATAIAMEEISYGDAVCGLLVSLQNVGGCGPLMKYGTEEQKRRFLAPIAKGDLLSAFGLTEPQGGSDNAAMTMRAVKRGGRYVLNGTKTFMSSGSNADIALVVAVTDPDAGKHGMSAFLVPTASKGYRVVRVEEKLGLRASDTCQVAFDDVEVDEQMRIGREGEGLKVALSNLESGRIYIACMAVGVAQAAFDAAFTYAQERRAFGKVIYEHQAVSFRLAMMATRIEAARQLTHHAAALRDAGEPCFLEACMAKLTATDMAEQVCSDAMQTFGGYGYLNDFPIERLCRDVRITRIFEGTNDIQQMVIARELPRRAHSND